MLYSYLTSSGRSWQRGGALAAVAVGCIGMPLPEAEAAPTVTVNADTAVLWQGQVKRDGPHFAGIPQCQTAGCDRAKVKVRLPRTLRERPGAVQIAIRFPTGSFGDSLALHAYRGSMLVASSAGQVGTAQSLEVPKADADYDIYVAYNPFIPEIAVPELSYAGRAENEERQAVRPRRELLPDLEVLPQEIVTFATPAPIFGDSAPAGSSCFNSEIQEQGASVCLRLAQSAANVGHGPVDVRWSVDAETPEPEVAATQRVYRSDGTFRERSAGGMHFHEIHNHYHFENFSLSQLYRIGRDGRPTGPPVASGTKNGFCMADTGLYWWERKGDAPQAYPAPRCLELQETVDGRNYFKNGMSRGWSDEYGWDLPDQMIEVSKVPDGEYLISTRIDSTNKLLEERDGNNCIMIKVRLKNMADARRNARLVGDPLACPARSPEASRHADSPGNARSAAG
jgi:hypothetical protein